MRRVRKNARALCDSFEPRLLLTAAVGAAQSIPAILQSLLVESIDGSGNNLFRPSLGAANTDLLRLAPAAYADGISSPAGANRPSARAVSNAIDTQTTDIENDRDLSDVVYVFGQFLDHDIDLTPTDSGESFDIPIPQGDPSFDPLSTGTQTMPVERSSYDPATGTSKSNPRQQINVVTSFIDGSQIYGSDPVRADALRAHVGGLLKTSPGDLLPYNTEGLPNANDAQLFPDDQLFLAGDVRANENIELTAMQTLFMREHNRIATQLAQAHPGWTDEQLFQGARRVVIAELQSITVNEFLPALLGRNALGAYRGYNPRVNPSIATEFSTVAFRFGHSMLDGDVDRIYDDGSAGDTVLLRNAFFNPTLLDASLPDGKGDIDPIVKGFISGDAQEIDTHIVDDVRNFLFGPPGAGGDDLAARNIQRGRDNGLPDYNTLRAAYGLPRVHSFAQITSDPALQQQLKETYGSVNNIDPWVGGLAEDHISGGSMGPLFARIISDQFKRLRDGDRFWFENTFKGAALRQIENTTLADIIQRNTSIPVVQKNVFFFHAPTASTVATAPAQVLAVPAVAAAPSTTPDGTDDADPSLPADYSLETANDPSVSQAGSAPLASGGTDTLYTSSVASIPVSETAGLDPATDPLADCSSLLN